MKRGGHMHWITAIVGILALGIIIWFTIPYSPMKAQFEHLKGQQNAELHPTPEVFDHSDIADLPQPLQTYFNKCGFLGQPKMVNIKILHQDVDFVLNNRKLKITCTQYNSALKPERIALIDTSLYGIPFEGMDAYQNGIGSMTGVIAKNFTLFQQTGEAMNKSSLVNCLAESLLVPNIALQDFITWEAIDDRRVKGTISCYGISASGIFTFNENGFLERFTTDDRLLVDSAGIVRQVHWSALCGDYREVNGIMQPKSLQAVWHLPEGDLVYFDGHDTVVQYNQM